MTTENEKHVELRRETERLVPELFGTMFGNGSFHMDTDTLDLADPRDHHTIQWLARIMASRILQERDLWRPTQEALRRKVDEQDGRLATVEGILTRLRVLANEEEFDTEKALKEIARYRTNAEEFYDRRGMELDLIAGIAMDTIGQAFINRRDSDKHVANTKADNLARFEADEAAKQAAAAVKKAEAAAEKAKKTSETVAKK